MAMALRSRLRPSSMNSRNGSQADGAGLGFSDPTPLKPTPNPVVTSMAGFESWLLLFLLSGRFSGLMLRFSPAISGLDPVVTSLAGFAGTRPQHRVPVRQYPPLSGTRFRFLDAHRSLARSAARTSPDALML